MANMREIKLRIKSIKETRQITKAFKLISAVKLKKARQQLEEVTPFFDKVRETMIDILLHSEDIECKYIDYNDDKENKDNKPKKVAFLILSGDKGLAGGYNINLFKLADDEIKKFDNPRLYIAGNVGRGYYKRKGANLDEDFYYPVQNPSILRALDISALLIDKFNSGEIDEVYLVYTLCISTIKLEPKIMKLLPLDIRALREDLGLNSGKEVKRDMMLSYEPSPNAVLEVLIKKYVKGIIYGALVEAFTSEQSARMTAMDNATSNADEMLQYLNLYYNRARQAAITQEITEIVGGAEALQ